MQASIGCAQLEKIEYFSKRRQENFNRLKEGLKDYTDKIILPESTENSIPSWFGFLITCKDEVDRNELVKSLEKSGIQTRNLFAGNIIKHPCFNEMRKNNIGYRVVGELKNTDKIMNNSFWIGVYPGMTDEMIDYMVERIKEYSNVRN